MTHFTHATSRPVVTIVSDGNIPDALDRLRNFADFRVTTGSELDRALPGSDALLLWDFFDNSLEHFWAKADRLRWVHVAAAGVDHVLFPAMITSDVVLTNAHGIFDLPIAEYVLACIFEYVKELPATRADAASFGWRTRTLGNVAGSTALVIGIGGIGREIARLLAAVGIRVEAVGTTARIDTATGVRVHAADDLEDLAGRFDFVVLALPSTQGTSGLIDRRILSAMRPDTFIINVGRGNSLDEIALADLIESGDIAGAALDVFAHEPLPGASRLWHSKRVLVSPHTSSRTSGWRDRLWQQFADKLTDYCSGRALSPVVDKRKGYVSVGLEESVSAFSVK